VIRASSSLISSSRSATRWANDDNEALVAAVTGSAERVGAGPGPRRRTRRWEAP
jgi:hypothetical protein